MLTSKQRTSINQEWAIWIVAREWASGDEATIGLWTGGYSRQFVVAGQVRQYEGASTLLGLQALTYQPGASVVQTQTVEVGGITPEVELALRGYNARRAKIEIHQINMDPTSENILSIERVFKGEIDTIEFNESEMSVPEMVGMGTCEITVASVARNGTRSLTLMKSDASQKLFDVNDDGRKYSDVSGSVPVTWMGETRNPHRVSERRPWIERIGE